MKTLQTNAFLYNVRRVFPNPEDNDNLWQTDYDDQTTIDEMIRVLRGLGYKVLPIEADDTAFAKLKEHRKEIDLAYNFSIGTFGQNRYAQIPAILEMLQIPYTGSDVLTQALILNKYKMQEVLKANDIPVLPSQLFESVNDKLTLKEGYPYMVKPVAQGSSAGISNDSVVNSIEELKRQVGWIRKYLNQGALVQPFLTGREFSIPLLGNPPECLPIVEPVFSKLPEKFLPLDSLEVKWIYEDAAVENHLACPASVTSELKAQIENLAKKTFAALNMRDYCRIDMRQSQTTGEIYILDVNSPPGMQPPVISKSSYFPLSAGVSGLEYSALLKRILETAWKRYNSV